MNTHTSRFAEHSVQVLCTQGGSGGKVNILGRDCISHGEEKVHMNMRLILNGYRDRVVCIWHALFFPLR
jgi:hypothetical protein